DTDVVDPLHHAPPFRIGGGPQPLAGRNILIAGRNSSVQEPESTIALLRFIRSPRRAVSIRVGQTFYSRAGGGEAKTPSSMTLPQEIALSLIVAVCAAATGRLA